MKTFVIMAVLLGAWLLPVSNSEAAEGADRSSVATAVASPLLAQYYYRSYRYPYYSYGYRYPYYTYRYPYYGGYYAPYRGYYGRPYYYPRYGHRPSVYLSPRGLRLRF